MPRILNVLPGAEPGITLKEICRRYSQEPYSGALRLSTSRALDGMVTNGLASKKSTKDPDGRSSNKFAGLVTQCNGEFLFPSATPVVTPSSALEHQDDRLTQHGKSPSTSLDRLRARAAQRNQSHTFVAQTLSSAIGETGEQEADPIVSSEHRSMNQELAASSGDSRITEDSQERRDAHDLELLRMARASKKRFEVIKSELSERDTLMRQAEGAKSELESQATKEEAEEQEFFERARRLRTEALEVEALAAERHQSVLRLRNEAGDRKREQESHAAQLVQTREKLAKIAEETRKANAKLGL